MKRAPDARQVSYLQSICGSDAAQNGMEVIFYRLFGGIQVRGDFVVGEALRVQRDELLDGS